jgi:F-type H+-transporting ATPase subunit alpha
VLAYYSLINGLMDNVPVEKIREFEAGLYRFADLNNEVLELIKTKKELDAEIEEKIRSLVSDYGATLDYLV